MKMLLHAYFGICFMSKMLLCAMTPQIILSGGSSPPTVMLEVGMYVIAFKNEQQYISHLHPCNSWKSETSQKLNCTCSYVQKSWIHLQPVLICTVRRALTAFVLIFHWNVPISCSCIESNNFDAILNSPVSILVLLLVLLHSNY